MSKTIEKKRIKPFAQWLHEQPTGLHGDLSEGLQEVVQAAREAPGKVGTLTMKIRVKMNGRGQVVVADDVTVTRPKPERGLGMFWADDEGNLERDDPSQMKIPLREVPAGVDPATGEITG